jgi:hypothetical protein
MKTMRDRLGDLPLEQQRQLQYAFEQKFSQFVRVDGDKFVGVNVQSIRHLEITESAGTWSYGQIKGK